MKTQGDVTEKMRMILVDWLVEVREGGEMIQIQSRVENPSTRLTSLADPSGSSIHSGRRLTRCNASAELPRVREVHWKFKLSPETLFLTVHLLDRSRGETAADLRHAAQHIRHIDPNPVNTF